MKKSKNGIDFFKKRKNSPDESLKIKTKPPQGVGYMLEKGD